MSIQSKNRLLFFALIFSLFVLLPTITLADYEWELVLVIGRGAIYELDLSPDDTMLAVATSIGVWIYDSQTFEVLHFFDGYHRRVATVDWSPDSKQLVVGSYSGELDIWDVDTEQRNRLFDEEQWRIEATAWSSDGQTIAFSTSDYDNEIIRIWSVTEEQIILEIEDLALSLAWSPDSSLLATGSNHILHIRDKQTGEALNRFVVSQRYGEWPFRSIAWSPDGKRIASTTENGTLNIWTLENRELLYLQDYYFGFSNVTWSPDGKQILAGTIDDMFIFDSFSGKVIETIETALHGVPRIRSIYGYKSIHSQWSSDGETLYIAGWHEYINRWDVDTGMLQNSTDGHYRFISTMEWSPNRNILAIGLFDSSVRLWDDETYEQITPLFGQGDTIVAMSWSHDGTLLATGSIDARSGGPPGSLRPAPNYGQTLRIWDVDNQQQLFGLADNSGASVDSILWSANDNILISATYKGINVWDMNSGELLQVFEMEYDYVYPLDMVWLSQENSIVIVAERMVWTLNLTTGEVTELLSSESVRFNELVESAHNEILAIGTKFNVGTEVWNVFTQELVETYETDDDISNQTGELSFDGSLRAILLDDTIQLWTRVSN